MSLQQIQKTVSRHPPHRRPVVHRFKRMFIGLPGQKRVLVKYPSVAQNLAIQLFFGIDVVGGSRKHAPGANNIQMCVCATAPHKRLACLGAGLLKEATHRTHLRFVQMCKQRHLTQFVQHHLQGIQIAPATLGLGLFARRHSLSLLNAYEKILASLTPQISARPFAAASVLDRAIDDPTTQSQPVAPTSVRAAGCPQ